MAGEVVAVGGGVDSFAVGDKVIGHLSPKVRTRGSLWNRHMSSSTIIEITTFESWKGGMQRACSLAQQ